MIDVTKHAIERYIERVKPACEPKFARVELMALVRVSELQSEPPPWVQDHRGDRSYMVPTDGVALVVVGRKVTTVLTRGGHDEAKTVQRRIEKRKKRRARRFKGSWDKGGGDLSTISPDGLKKPAKKEWDRP